MLLAHCEECCADAEGGQGCDDAADDGCDVDLVVSLLRGFGLHLGLGFCLELVLGRLGGHHTRLGLGVFGRDRLDRLVLFGDLDGFRLGGLNVFLGLLDLFNFCLIGPIGAGADGFGGAADAVVVQLQGVPVGGDEDFFVADVGEVWLFGVVEVLEFCLLYTSPSPRDRQKSRMPSSA